MLICAIIALALAAPSTDAQPDVNCTIATCSKYPTVGLCANDSCDCVLLRDPTINISRCFFVDNATGLCVEDKGPDNCYTYFEDVDQCRFGRLFRLPAILLSVFLFNFGAGNFYIQRYELAIPQLLVGLIACVFQIGSCAERCVSDEESKATKACVFCWGFNVLFSCLLFAWWLADLIIFALNYRLDGKGCPLLV